MCKRLPFAWRSPFGFLVAVVIQYTMMSYAAMIGACIIAFAFGFYLYTTAMTKCIKGILFHVNRSAESKTNRKMVHKQIVEFIRFHSRVKQLSKRGMKIIYIILKFLRFIVANNSYASDFSDFFRGFIALLFSWSLVTICGVLLQIQVDIVKYCIDLPLHYTYCAFFFHSFSCIIAIIWQ